VTLDHLIFALNPKAGTITRANPAHRSLEQRPLCPFCARM
jgi:hypothetical protein